MLKKGISLLLLLALFATTFIPALAENLNYYFVATFSASPKFYTGPGTNYLRAGNGKAQYGGGGEARVYGYEGNWILMGYQTGSGQYRIGYISDEFLAKMKAPEGAKLRSMRFEYRPGYISSACDITDDPILKYVAFGQLSRGQSCTYLASYDDRWAYIEVTLASENKKARGFVPLNNVTFSQPHTVTAQPFIMVTPTPVPRTPAPTAMPVTDYSTGFYTSGPWATASQTLYTYSGPGFQYTNTGVYYLSNQPVYCLAKHYDYSSQSWWILCRIFDGNAAQYVWAQSQAFYSPDWLLSRLAEE